MKVLVEQTGVFAGLKLLGRPFDDLPHLLSPVEAGHADLVGRQQVGDAEVGLRGIGHQRERILGLAEEPTRLTIGQIAAAPAHQLRQHDERRQIGSPAQQIRRHAAGMRRVDAAGEPSARLHHLPAGVVHGRTVVPARPDKRELVGDGRVFRQQLRDLEGVALRPDRLERAADLRRRVGLHVPEVELARSPEIEDHDAGAILVARPHLPFARRSHILRQRQPRRGKRPHLEEIPAAGAAAAEQGPLAGLRHLKFKHVSLLIGNAAKTACTPHPLIIASEERPCHLTVAAAFCI